MLVARAEVARVWDVNTGGPLTAPAEASGVRVSSGAFSPDGRLVATASADGTARVWDAATGEPVTPPLFHGGVARPGGIHESPQVAFTPAGDRVVVASWAGVRAWGLRPDPRPIDELALQAADALRLHDRPHRRPRAP